MIYYSRRYYPQTPDRFDVPSYPLPGKVLCPAGLCVVPEIWGAVIPPCPHYPQYGIIC